MSREFEIGAQTKLADVGHDVVSPTRRKRVKASFAQSAQQAIAPQAIALRKLFVIARGKRQRNRSRFLHWSGRANR